MKNSLITLALMVAVTAAAFGVSYAVCREPGLHPVAAESEAMTWLRTEFQLNDAEFAAIKTIHEEYGVVCGRHCAAIMAARTRSAPPAEIAALEKTCVEAMTGHFKNVAALMSAEQGKRYLATVLPRVESHGHATAPNVQVSH